MATPNTALKFTSMDFFSIKDDLKDFLRSQNRFNAYDFEGDDLNILLDLLAYNTHKNAYMGNMLASEAYLDTAQLRQSVIRKSKEMNYLPTSQLSSTAIVDILVTPEAPEDTSLQTATIFKYTPFVSENNNGLAYNFVSMDTVTETKTANGTFEFTNITLKQGEVVTTQSLFDYSSNPKRRFNIPSANVDITTLQIIVQESVSNTAYSVYEQATDITELSGNSKVYFIEESSEANGIYTFTFGDNYIGKKPADGAVIICTYIDTVGPVADKSRNFTLTGTISGFSQNVTVTTANVSSGGSYKEDIDTIKFRAPIWYTTQNRGVIDKDYEILLLKDYPNISAISVWGGEDNDPPVYGKIFISMKPKDGYYITTDEKQRITDEIIASRSVMTVTPEIIDPKYLYLILNISVRYNPSLTSLDEDSLKSLVREAVIDYKETDLERFNSIFRPSKFQYLIEQVDSSILSSSLNYYVQKRLEPDLTQSKNYTIDFYTTLKNGTVLDRMYTYPGYEVTDRNGITRYAKIEEIPDTLTGISSIKIISGGSGYTSVPSVSIVGDGVGATATASLTNGIVTKITMEEKGTGYTAATVTISGGGGSGATAKCLFQANQATLQAFYYRNTGEKVILNSNQGTIRYDIGRITLRNFNPLSMFPNANYSDTILTFNVRPDADVVRSSRNQIVTIDENDSSSIVITMVPEKV